MFDDIVGTVKKGWTIGPLTAVQHKGKTLRLYQCTKTCRDCGATMRHNMNRAALEGRVKNRGIDYTRCADCRNGRRKPAEEPAAPVMPQPQDAIAYLVQRNEALTIENAELKAAAKFAAKFAAAVPNPVATPAQATTPGADTAELEALRKFRLDVFGASRYVEHTPMYINAAGVKTYDRLGPEQVTNANLLAHVKEVGDTYDGMFHAIGGYNNLKEGLNKAAYYASYALEAELTLDSSVHDRIDSEAQREADAKYPM